MMDGSQWLDLREKDSRACALSCSTLPEAQRTEIRQQDRIAHQIQRTTVAMCEAELPWWEQVGLLNVLQTAKPLGLQWNRVCRICSITVGITFASSNLH